MDITHCPDRASLTLVGQSLIRFLKEFTPAVARLDSSAKLHRACRRIIPPILNAYLDHVVGKEPEPPSNKRLTITCDQSPMCTACSAINAFLDDPDRISLRYVLEAEAYKHMRVPLKGLQTPDLDDYCCKIVRDGKISHHDVQWENLSISNIHVGENTPYQCWESRAREADVEFQRVVLSLLKTFLGEAYEGIISMSRIRFPEDALSSISTTETGRSSAAVNASTSKGPRPLPWAVYRGPY